QGEPLKPRSAVSAPSSSRSIRSARSTYCSRSTTPSTDSFSMSAFVVTVKSIRTPPVSLKRYVWPIASGITRMSLNKIAASKPNRRTGCNVTSTASSGFCTSCTKVYFSLSRRYSGSARPACRMSHTGGRSTGRQCAAAKNLWRLVSGGAEDLSWPAEILVIINARISETPGRRERLFARNFTPGPVFNWMLTMNNEPSNHEFPAPPDSELDARLTRALARLPDVPVPSNFSSRLMQSVELDELRQSRRRSFAWDWHKLLPRIAVTAAVVLIAGLTLRQHEGTARRTALARNLAMVAGAQPM